FDFEGVARHLKNPHQIDVFRKCVTDEEVAPHLAVDQQAGLAERLVKLAEEEDRELSGALIRELITTQIIGTKGQAEGARPRQVRVFGMTADQLDAAAASCPGGVCGLQESYDLLRSLENFLGWVKRKVAPLDDDQLARLPAPGTGGTLNKAELY